MKKLYSLLIMVSMLSLYSAGCGSDPVSANANVNFTMAAYNTQAGNVDFTATPSADVKLTKLVLTLPAQNFSDTLSDNGTTVYTAGTAYTLGREYQGVASGQQWKFYFTGTLASDNTAFTDLAVDYTIP
jgi:hypothetical protein